MLHFETFNPQAPKKGEPGFDKIRPVRIIFDMFKSACLSNWHMGQYVSVDEAMQKMKGKSPVRTYMPNKPVKYGYKFWCLCCAGTGDKHRLISILISRQAQIDVDFDIETSTAYTYIYIYIYVYVPISNAVIVTALIAPRIN